LPIDWGGSLSSQKGADRRESHDKATESGEPFLSDIKELRRRAREHIQSGAVTEGYRGDRDTVLRLLNEALATELVCARGARAKRPD
jgi:hypothetical protein